MKDGKTDVVSSQPPGGIQFPGNLSFYPFMVLDSAYPVAGWAKMGHVVNSPKIFAVQFRHRSPMHVEPQVGPRRWRQARPLDAMAAVDVLKGME